MGKSSDDQLGLRIAAPYPRHESGALSLFQMIHPQTSKSTAMMPGDMTAFGPATFIVNAAACDFPCCLWINRVCPKAHYTTQI